MTTISELGKLMRDTVLSLTSVTEVIEYHPNAPRPSAEYASVWIGPLSRVGRIDKKESTSVDDVGEKIAMVFESSISFNFYRGEAMQEASMFIGGIQSQFIVDSFNEANVGYIGNSEIRDLTQLMGSGHEKRSQVDVIFQFELTPVERVVTGIDTVIVSGEADNGSEVIETIDISVAHP